MGQEIERKFLVKEHTFKKQYSQKQEIRQGYLCVNKNKVVRIRTLDKKGFLTVKGKTIGITRSEFEYEIPKKDALEMLHNLCPSLVEKVRYIVPHEDMQWEVDEFFNDNQGLILAEIELKNEDQHFSEPPWLGKEVTGDKRYYNASLSEYPFKKWKHT